MKKIFVLIGVAFAMVCFASCVKQAVPFIETTGVTINPTSLSIFDGEVSTIDVSITPSDATSSYKIWTSSNPDVASVDGWGRVTGKAPGNCVITVKTASGGHTASCNVTIKPVEETAVSIDPEELEVYYDESGTVTASIEPSNASYKTVTWSSEDPSIASVDKDGKVKGEGLGTTNIVATTHFGLVAKCKVTVSVRMPTEPEEVDIWKSDKAGFRGLFGAAADEGKTAENGDWLKYEEGAARWTANETGKIRTATLTLSTGSSITVTQLDGQDFVGSWTLKSRLFNKNGSVPDKPKGTTGACSSAVTITAVSNKPDTLDGHANAFELSGLYLDAKMKVAFDIDYDKKVAKMGLFFDRRTTQLAKAGVYCAFIPELEGSRWGNYNFAPATFGVNDCNYEWMWCISEDFNTFRYKPHTQHVLSGKSDLMLIGISIVVGPNSNPAALGTEYDTIYQANFNGSDTEGLSIFR